MANRTLTIATFMVLSPLGHVVRLARILLQRLHETPDVPDGFLEILDGLGWIFFPSSRDVLDRVAEMKAHAPGLDRLNDFDLSRIVMARVIYVVSHSKASAVIGKR